MRCSAPDAAGPAHLRSLLLPTSMMTMLESAWSRSSFSHRSTLSKVTARAKRAEIKCCIRSQHPDATAGNIFAEPEYDAKATGDIEALHPKLHRMCDSARRPIVRGWPL